MIKNIILLAFFLPFLTCAKQDSLTYDQTQDIKFAEQYENNTEINFYVTKDGLKISIGDTLTIGNAVINGKKYMFHDVFSHIVIGNTQDVYNKEFSSLPHKYAGSKIIVKSLFVMHEKLNGFKLWPNRKQTPLYVNIFTRSLQVKLNLENRLAKIFSYSRKTILDIEKALLLEEIVNHNAPLSKEEAIAKLKESKDLMELDFLSKEEYEKLKEMLSPIILDKHVKDSN